MDTLNLNTLNGISALRAIIEESRTAGTDYGNPRIAALAQEGMESLHNAASIEEELRGQVIALQLELHRANARIASESAQKNGAVLRLKEAQDRLIEIERELVFRTGVVQDIDSNIQWLLSKQR